MIANKSVKHLVTNEISKKNPAPGKHDTVADGCPVARDIFAVAIDYVTARNLIPGNVRHLGLESRAALGH